MWIRRNLTGAMVSHVLGALMWFVVMMACRSANLPTAAEPSAPVPPVEAPVTAEPAPPAPPEPIPAEGAFTRELAPGLTLAAFLPPVLSEASFSKPDAAAIARCDPRLYVVTIDPAIYEIVYGHVNAAENTLGQYTGPEWAERLDAHVVFNPGMFEPDRSATGYTRGGAYLSRGSVRRNALYRGFFAAESAADPHVARVIDAVPPKGSGTYGAYDELPAEVRAELDGYGVVAQSLTVLRAGQPAFPARNKQWSELAFGADDQGRVVVVFSRYPYEMREFGALVAALDLGIRDLVHGEGGPEATLAVRVGGLEWFVVGSYETGFYDDSNHHAWSLPAMMAARPRR